MENAITEAEGTVTVDIEVVPNSKQFSIVWDEWRQRFKFKITSKAQKGKANEEVLSFFRKLGDSWIIGGALNREKSIGVSAKKEDVLSLIRNNMR